MDNPEVMHPAIKLRHIRVFLDIAAEGGLSAVARRHGVTQPALSRSLAELETLLGQSLFLRQGRRLILTEQGALFRRQAAQGLHMLEAAATALQAGPAGRLRIGVLPTVATRFFPQVALRFHSLRPETVLAIETGPHHYLVRQLREGAIDAMVGRLPTVAELPGLRFDHLYDDDVILVARAGHPALTAPLAEALSRSPLILPPATALIRPQVEAFLAAQGLAGRRATYETVSLALGRAICLGSDAVWFISQGVVADELDSGALVRLPTDARFLSGAVGMTRRQADSPPDLALLEEIARDLAARQGAG